MGWKNCVTIVLVITCALVTARGAAPAAAELLAQAREALSKGDNDRAADLADRAVKAEPENPAPYLFRAGLMEALGQPDMALADYDALIRLSPEDAGAYQRRGVLHFKQGRFKESVADFDKVLELRPAEKPYHWQRGISLYYAGEYEAGREQFELHQTVNRNDVENAAWHYLCVARMDGVEKARESLIPIVGDPRVPMAQVHALYAGKVGPEAVLEAARKAKQLEQGEQVKGQLFYAHLYLGLFYEASGQSAKAKEHMDLAAGEYAQDHYMGEVARVHAKLLEEKADQVEEKKKEPAQ